MSDLPEDFTTEISILRASRPTLTAIELGRVRSRAIGMPDGPRSGPWQRFVRTRGAVVATIAAGALMSTGGTAMGISGLAAGSDPIASIAQYGGSVGSGALGNGPSSPSPAAPTLSGAPASASAPSSASSPAGVGSSAPSSPAGVGSSAPSGASSPPGVSAVSPSTASAPSAAVSPAEAAAQAPVVTSGQLPFTGFLALPVLLIGIALLVLGLVGRRIAGRAGDIPPT